MKKSDFDIFGEAWGITAEALESILHTFYKDESAMAGISGEASKGPDYPVDKGIAIIRVAGSLYRYSYDRIRAQVASAIANHGVRAVLLLVLSPGGLVSGCKELADFIAQAGKTKNIYAYADGAMCSAAYWIGSAAGEIAAPVTASVGSIGVRTVHVDWSKWNDKAGLSFTHVAAGSYKTLGNEDEPLSKKAKDYIQTRLDSLYTIFVDSVAGNRNVSKEKALAMADGRVFLANDAKEIGLIDRVEQDFQSYFSHILKKEKIMDLTTLKESHPDLYAKVLDEGKTQAEAGGKESMATAVSAETERVLGLAGAVLGKETADKFTAVVKSGASVDVVTSLKETFGFSSDKASGEEHADATTRQDILKGLESAHSDGVHQEQAREGTGGDQDLEQQAKAFADLANM
jgi:signal peptide peptidase SppA